MSDELNTSDNKLITLPPIDVFSREVLVEAIHKLHDGHEPSIRPFQHV